MLLLSKMSKVGVEVPDSPGNSSYKTLDLAEEKSVSEKRVPKRILHFSDGTLEEYSSDEDETDKLTNSPGHGQVLPANTSQLPWMPWFWYHTVFVGSKALAACDFLGESLANFFGILSPKYEYEIEQYKRAIAEEIERQKQDAELGSWKPPEAGSTSQPIQTEPQRY